MGCTWDESCFSSIFQRGDDTNVPCPHRSPLHDTGVNRVGSLICALFFSLNSVNVISLPHDLLNPVFFSRAPRVVRIPHVTHVTYKMCVRRPFICPVRMLFICSQVSGETKVTCGFSAAQGVGAPRCPRLNCTSEHLAEFTAPFSLLSRTGQVVTRARWTRPPSAVGSAWLLALLGCTLGPILVFW